MTAENIFRKILSDCQSHSAVNKYSGHSPDQVLLRVFGLNDVLPLDYNKPESAMVPQQHRDRHDDRSVPLHPLLAAVLRIRPDRSGQLHTEETPLRGHLHPLHCVAQ